MLDISAIPAEMVLELAIGAEDPANIAARHGFSRDEYGRLSRQSWFQRGVADKVKELEAAGFTFKAKMAMLAEDLLVKTYQEAKAGESISLKLDVAKYLAKLADLEPRPTALPAGTGAAGFAINIIFPESRKASVVPPRAAPVIEATANPAPSQTAVPVTDTLGPAPGFVMPTFSLQNNVELRGHSVPD